ncbi:hypothetical protein EJ997_10180 [Flaviflexus ciconiae]|uniref:Uncharacterized protein n=1 Tax=Flaviflexus ciconiae TaxID=2496867 RepID=A0A3Q9G576_9ACTO|nr:hypothetical protein [Flaviflexus ciconiae]AZQ77650.1 hypothetical protein EJ997_10180 [Flaviflexus ciconiae]
MNPQARRDLAARVLATAASCDNRRLASDDERQMAVAFWAEALHPETTLADATNAVIEHYATTTDWLMPAHVNKLTATYRRERLLDTEVPYPPGLADSPQLENEWRRAWHQAVKQGASPETAQGLAWERIGRTPPRELPAAPTADVKAALARFKTTFGRKTR